LFTIFASLGGNSSLNTPVVSLQTPSLTGLYQSSYSAHGGSSTAQPPEFSITSDIGLSSLHSVHGAWGAAPGPNNSNSSGVVHHPGHISSNIHISSLSHLTIPSSNSQRPPSAPLSPSPGALKIKSEPISPPREAMSALQGGMGSSSGLGQTLAPTSGMGLIQRPSSSSDHLSPPGHLTPTGHHNHSEYDAMPLHKRPRIAEGWGAS